MVIQVMKWDIHPDKVEAYLEWTESAIKRTLAVPGVVEFRGYRAVTGAPQVVVTYEFADLATWAAWYGNEEIQEMLTEVSTLTLNKNIELWGPTPIVPVPIRPGE